MAPPVQLPQPRPVYGFGDDASDQLLRIFSADLDTFGASGFQGVDSFGATLYGLGAEVRANEMMYGADAPQTQLAKAKLVGAASRFQQMALARGAGKIPFDTTSEKNTMVRKEGLPITPTLIPAGAGGNAGLLAPASFTFAVRPTRSQQINRIVFASGDAATAACVLINVEILGQSQLNGPGGIPCGLYSEVMTEPNLKGATAQAGQDILITIGNTSAVAQVIRGALFGPDLVRMA